jgi:hypothetical protein
MPPAARGLGECVDGAARTVTAIWLRHQFNVGATGE